MIIGLLLFLITNKGFTQYRYLNPIDTTYNLDFWEVHEMVKVYDDWEILLQEVNSFYEKEEYMIAQQKELNTKTTHIALLENSIDLKDRKIMITDNLLEGCNNTLIESDKLIQDLSKEVKKLSRIQSFLEIATGASLTIVVSVLLRLIT